MTSTARALGQERARPASREQAIGGVRFDWAMVALMAWWVGAIFLDGWAHQHGKVDQSFFRAWHAVLYSGFLAVAALLWMTIVLNTRRGYRGWQAVPTGYEGALLGTALFAMGGAADLVWHTLFGIEANTAALLSPTHLVLAAGAVLAMAGPLGAAWRRPTPIAGLAAALPVRLSVTFILSTGMFMAQFAHPLVNAWAANQPGASDVISQLWVMNADGTGQTRLFNDPSTASWHAAYSPDGRQIAYAAGQADALQIMMADADGAHPQQLTHDPGNHLSPACLVRAVQFCARALRGAQPGSALWRRLPRVQAPSAGLVGVAPRLKPSSQLTG